MRTVYSLMILSVVTTVGVTTTDVDKSDIKFESANKQSDSVVMQMTKLNDSLSVANMKKVNEMNQKLTVLENSKVKKVDKHDR